MPTETYLIISRWRAVYGWDEYSRIPWWSRILGHVLGHFIGRLWNHLACFLKGHQLILYNDEQKAVCTYCCVEIPCWHIDTDSIQEGTDAG